MPWWPGKKKTVMEGTVPIRRGSGYRALKQLAIKVYEAEKLARDQEPWQRVLMRAKFCTGPATRWQSLIYIKAGLPAPQKCWVYQKSWMQTQHWRQLAVVLVRFWQYAHLPALVSRGFQYAENLMVTHQPSPSIKKARNINCVCAHVSAYERSVIIMSTTVSVCLCLSACACVDSLSLFSFISWWC